MAFHELVIEAVKKTSVVATKIANNLSLAEFKNISRMKDMDKNYLLDLASSKYIYFDDLKDDEKQEVVEKVWNKVKSEAEETQIENNSEKPLSQDELKQKIINYVKQNGAVLYPLEDAAEKLSQELASIKKESECACCGKEPCECDDDCKCKEEDTLTEGVMKFKISSKKNSYGDKVYYISQIKLDNGEIWNNYPKMLFGPDNTYDDKASAKRAIERYMQDRGEYKIIGESITEAVMNDIPHEIDDQIHTLKDMRFDLEQTQRNWDLAGIKTEPMDEILSNIDDLIANLYQNGAKMADDELSKGNSKEPKEDEKQDEEKEEKKSIQGDKQ